MFWLLITLLAYLILALSFLIDKYLLTGAIPSPKVYAFYVGVAGILVLFLIPFVGFKIPEPFQIFLSLLAGAIFFFALFWFYKSLQLFEPSRIVTTIGAIIPLFTFGLIFIFSKGEERFTITEFSAFILLILGSFLITHEPSKRISFRSLIFSMITAFSFALYFFLAKYIYTVQSFWNGIIWMRIGGFLIALGFLFFSTEVREEILKKQQIIPKNSTLFLFNQGLGATGNVLLNWAIALAPLIYVPIINALAGIQHAFLLILTIFLSLKIPQILKEEISKKIIFQKIIAILIISCGLTLLSFK